jgi:prolyl-tRNA synthetase
MSQEKTAITPRRDQDFPEWYQQVVRAADLAENSEVRGCMVIKPWGYGIWENIQRYLDGRFKETGHSNAYFPLLIPLSYLEKEAQHAEGFATECAVVTHHRLETQKQPDGSVKMVPTGELTEPFVIRPTSETIIGAAFARWTESYRDLPLLINQWANVMRWEMRPRLFLRTAEFLWQEGHTAHETQEEAMVETKLMHRVYEEFLRDYLAVPVIAGEKTPRERFPGALNTFTVEAMVQDRKAIQAGTSHFLGQNFAKAANIEFLGRDNKKQYAWTTSWGVSTRTIGTLIMAHADDDGIILPPRVAPHQIVILPVTPKPETRQEVIESCEALAHQLRKQSYGGEQIRVHVDKRDLPGGTRNWEWIKKGVPYRVEIGPRDIENRTVMVGKRHEGAKAKESLQKEDFIRDVVELLATAQEALLQRATAMRDANCVKLSTLEEFKDFFADKPGITGGFALMHWAGNADDEEKLAKEFKTTIRCIPLSDEYAEEGTCFITGKPSHKRVVFAKSY